MPPVFDNLGNLVRPEPDDSQSEKPPVFIDPATELESMDEKTKAMIRTMLESGMSVTEIVKE